MEKIPHSSQIDTVTPAEALCIVCGIFSAHFPGNNAEFITSVFQQTQNAFAGRHSGYQRCDTPFHDFAHTCQATVATVRILDGLLKSNPPLALTVRDFELGVAGILLHDIGFLKDAGDDLGTGAKHAVVHVVRSATFAEGFLPHFGVTPDEIRIVQLAIRSTALNVDMSKLAFRNERERCLGCVVGTGDILGTMAAPDYPERLPALYQELVEAAEYSALGEGEVEDYQSVEDLLRKTRDFYRNYVLRMLDQQWGQVYRALEHHFDDGHNHYLQAAEVNLNRIDRLFEGK
jgi:hypothetical protein